MSRPRCCVDQTASAGADSIPYRPVRRPPLTRLWECWVSIDFELSPAAYDGLAASSPPPPANRATVTTGRSVCPSGSQLLPFPNGHQPKGDPASNNGSMAGESDMPDVEALFLELLMIDRGAHAHSSQRSTRVQNNAAPPIV